MAMLIAIELVTLAFAVSTLSSVRTLVGAEGLWSKAQKDALYSLQKYGISHDEKDYAAYLDFLKVNLGDHKTRLELMKPNPDLGIARQGFLEGGLHPDDIDQTIKLILRFHSISYLANAIAVWTKGDMMIAQMQAYGDELHKEVQLASPSNQKINAILNQLAPLNSKLTLIEDDFSESLGAGSRWLTGLILKLLLSLVLTVEVSGLSLTIFVSRGITKGLNEIIGSSNKIAGGDYTVRANSYSKDEIGILANSFNDMTDKLEQNIKALKKSQEELQGREMERNRMIEDIVRRNKDLEQFSYIISHNLRGPVANILGLAEVLSIAKTSAEEDEMIMGEIFNAVTKLDNVISDLNYALQVKNQVNEKKEMVNFMELIRDIKTAINTQLKKEKVKIICDFSEAEEMYAIKSYCYSIFYNLISNSIKYRKPEIAPIIIITSKRTDNQIELIFQDNGLGFDLEKTGDDVFGLYKRFHFHTEGKGMGLYMVKTQVETQGGKIDVNSEIDKGTEFKLVFEDMGEMV
jgi:signal transduction histidine kinase